MTNENEISAKAEEEFARQKEELLRAGNEGRFVVGTAETGFVLHDSFEEALRYGCEHIGLKPFLVKQVLRREPVVYLPRM